jgi:hypothetical protein
MEMQLLELVLLEAACPGRTLQPAAHFFFRLLGAEKQDGAVLACGAKPVAKIPGNRNRELQRDRGFAAATIA